MKIKPLKIPFPHLSLILPTSPTLYPKTEIRCWRVYGVSGVRPVLQCLRHAGHEVTSLTTCIADLEGVLTAEESRGH